MPLIRPYRPSDWNEVCRIFDLAKPIELETAGAASSFVPLAQDGKLIERFTKDRIFLWENETRLEGFAGMRGNYISWLFVDPAFFRKGVGRALLRYLLSQIEGDAWLWSAKNNHAANALYRSAGFWPAAEVLTQNGGMPCLACKMIRSAPRLRRSG